MLSSAIAAEIIRSHQKDEYYIGTIRRKISDIAQHMLGPRVWIKWYKEFDVLSDSSYFLLTTLKGLQTLGEEYVNCIQYYRDGRSVPSLFRRFSMIVLQVGLPYILDYLLLYLKKKLQDTRADITEEERTKYLNFISTAQNLITLVYRCHLAAFYLQGHFYNISKRFTGINYIKVTSNRAIPEPSSLKLLGIFCILQLCFAFVKYLYQFVSSYKYGNRIKQEHSPVYKQKENNVTELHALTKCPLCLDIRIMPTATPCGHLFCWQCIYEWCDQTQNRTICPMCREKIDPSRLIYLHKFV